MNVGPPSRNVRLTKHGDVTVSSSFSLRLLFLLFTLASVVVAAIGIRYSAKLRVAQVQNESVALSPATSVRLSDDGKSIANATCNAQEFKLLVAYAKQRRITNLRVINPSNHTIARLRDLDGLETLYLKALDPEGPKVTDISALVDCKTLRELVLACNCPANTFEVLAKHEHLTKLSILTEPLEAKMRTISLLENISHLNILMSHATDEEMSAIRRALPNCEIKFLKGKESSSHFQIQRAMVPASQSAP